MTSGEGVQTREESATKRSSIPFNLTLAVVPLAVLTLFMGSFVVWILISSDSSSGFSAVDVAAVFVGAVVLIVTVGSLWVIQKRGRSLARRIEEVSSAARRVANEDLIELVDALRRPDPEIEAIAPLDLNTDALDEVGDLARSFEELHDSLVVVSARQMKALRGGVSSIIVTLARRNTSLVDRQLALLDELESREEDPNVLGAYYKLDHFATRMRRNAESLLVLAGEDPPRVWAKSMEMSDVVRAAVSEVDDYQRIELLALEPAQVSGGAVADIAHLLAELLDNATQFSPPTESVRVTALFDMDGYQLSITDRGVGMSNSRIAELNEVLQNPPALGLALEPTMGLYVVSKLAERHGINVDLVPGVPGLTVRVIVPRSLLERKMSKPPIQRQLGAHLQESAFASPGEGSDNLLVEYDDAATSEYVFARTRRAPDFEEQPQPVAVDGVDHIIDLTDPAPTNSHLDKSEVLSADGDELRRSREPDASSKDGSESDMLTENQEAGALPVRPPRQVFGDESALSPTIIPGDNATGIKLALSAYDRGRLAATPDEQDESVDSGDDESSLSEAPS